MHQGNFLQKLSDGLEESKNKVITKLSPGSTIVANNYFWLHGRRPFKEDKDLRRELLRIRGAFLSNWSKKPYKTGFKNRFFKKGTSIN